MTKVINTIMEPVPYKPGIYKNLSFLEYCMIDAINASSIKYFDESPKKYQWFKNKPWEGSASTELGNIVHTLVLERDEYDKKYFEMPEFHPIMGTTKTGNPKTLVTKKAQEEEYELQHIGKTAIGAATKEKAFLMAEAVTSHPEMSSLLLDTDRELTLVWESEYGLCKARIDAYKPGYIIDLKTTQSCKYRSIVKDIINFKYYLSQAWYRWGLMELGEPKPIVKLLCVENQPPFDRRVVRISDASLDAGIKEGKHYLKQLSECRKTGNYPGYPETEIVFDVPEYVEKEIDYLIGE